MKPAVTLVWFKRDLRLHDHAPLTQAIATELPVIPLYVVEEAYWQQPFASRRHWAFIHDCLGELRDDLSKLGQALVVRVGEVGKVLAQLRSHYNIIRIFAHEESSNGWTYERDKRVAAWCRDHQIPLTELPCNGVVRRLKSRDDWSAIRNQRMAQATLPKPVKLKSVADLDIGEIPDKSDAIFGPLLDSSVQSGGRRAAVQVLSSFLTHRGLRYLRHLSAPGASEQFCSRLSPHLAWGTLSVREVVQACRHRRQQLQEDNQLTDKEKQMWSRNLSAIQSRLSWRCHFVQKIEDQPEIEYECMHAAFEGMREEDHNPDYLAAWRAGKTGYPFVDACMRNLQAEGWITFRMRAMLVSFASYHLWLDWRQTGYVLARLFTDYEPGIHYSQLQMQSGVTGINAERIYNPIKQSCDQDPNGEFIRRWVPELNQVPSQWIHEPWLMSAKDQVRYACQIGREYPKPIVDHQASVKSARARMKQVRQRDDFRQLASEVYQKLGSRKSAGRSRQGSTRLRNGKQGEISGQLLLI